MLRFEAHKLCAFVRDLHGFQRDARQLQGNVSTADTATLAPILGLCDQVTSFFWLPATAARKQRVESALTVSCSYAELERQLTALSETIEDELANRMVLFMPPARAVKYLANEQLLGEATAKRFPQLSHDIDEAGKCFGTGRFTATVFHMMRIMEAGLQALGESLGVPLTSEKAWQVILDAVSVAIKKLPPKDTKTIALSAIAANLYAVKLAWRNQVMHPKETYTEEEAEGVVSACKAFMIDLAGSC